MKLCLLLVMLTQLVYAGYGDGDGAYLTNSQRQMTVLTNAVRLDPQGYRDKYLAYNTILLPATYTAVGPVYHNRELYNACQFHADDMVSSNKMQHASSDGTSFSERVKSYYTLTGWIAENIAAGNSDPFRTLDQWLYDKVNGVPAADGSGDDGHRKNIMNEKYSAMGVATAYGSATTYGNYWCQDFGGVSNDTYKIASGAHFEKDSKLIFMCNYYDDGAAPTKASLFLGSSQIEMTLHLGQADKGTYIFEIDNSDNFEYNYYFSFTDATGNVVRYPESETLVANSGGALTTAVESLPYENNNNNNIVVAPNPIIDVVNITLNEELGEEVTFQLVDKNQSTVLSQNSKGSIGKTSIDCAGVEAGVYFVLILVDGVVSRREMVYKQ